MVYVIIATAKLSCIGKNAKMGSEELNKLLAPQTCFSSFSPSLQLDYASNGSRIMIIVLEFLVQVVSFEERFCISGN